MKKYYQGKMDLWYFFTCKALDLLKDGGLHSYIAQNNWITSAGASILRNKILTDSKILSFFDFNDFKVFKDAGIQTMIFVLQKKKTNRSYTLDYYKIKDKNISKDELANYLLTKKKVNKIEHFKVKINPVEQKDKTITFVKAEVAEILEKIKSKANYYLTDKNVAQGIVCPQEFVIDSHIAKIGSNIKKGEGIFTLKTSELKLLKLNKKEQEVIKPLYTVDELHKYYANPKNKLWIIYSDIEVRKNINEFPNIKAHLNRFKKIITSDFKPYGLHRARDKKFFEGKKIVSLRKTSKPHFTYTDFSCYVTQTFFIIKPDDINLKFLTGLLNSKLIYFWLYYKGKRQGEQLQIDKSPLLQIPLIKKENALIIKNVDLLIELNKKLESINLEIEKEFIRKQIYALEKQIDERVYKLYKLTEKDIKFINENVK